MNNTRPAAVDRIAQYHSKSFFVSAYTLPLARLVAATRQDHSLSIGVYSFDTETTDDRMRRLAAYELHVFKQWVAPRFKVG